MTSFFDRLAARAGHGGDRREDFVGVRHKTGEGETSTPVEDKIGLAYAFLTTAKRLADAAEVHCALQTEPAGILAIKHAPEIAWAHEDADKLCSTELGVQHYEDEISEQLGRLVGIWQSS